MQLRFRHIFKAIGVLAILFFVSGTAYAQFPISNTASVALSLNVQESITVSATPASISFTPSADGLSATASGPISVTTSWNINGGHLSVKGYAGFNGTPVMSNGTATIDYSNFFASINGGAVVPFTLLNQGPAPASIVPGPLFTVASPAAGAVTRTDSILLSISGMATQFSPGVYTGTLNIVAQVN